ncbi:MAG: MmgE/PrpD family protein [Isosphaeraceae bacterium]|nr:MmgE/PrpD family protein [Isosphaeraceae bacterium]
MTSTLADRLVDFSLSVRFEDLPGEVVAEAVRRWVDTVGCALGALTEPAPTIARRVARSISSERGVRLFGGGGSALDWAAFANGVHIRYLDCNDTYLSLEPAHPSDNWAAIMAAGESVGADGRRWIEAAAVAYEIQCRLCDAASIRARGWDHVTYGALSTSLAVSKLFGLTHEQSVHALGIAGTTGTALRLTRAGELSMWKGCAFANAARVGVFSAMLARAGMTGPAPLFEGDMGFKQQVSGPFELERLGGPTAGDWMLPKTSIKFVPAEYHSQSAIAEAFELRKQRPGIVPSDIESIEIATFRTAVEIIGKDPEKWRPSTRETADHSLPYCTAVALIDGEVTARQFSDDRLRDPDLIGLVGRTTVVEDPALTAGYPAGIPNRITIRLVDGTVLKGECSFPPGHDKNPLSDAGLDAKFHGLADEFVGRAVAEEILARSRRLAEDPAPHEVLDAISNIA